MWGGDSTHSGEILAEVLKDVLRRVASITLRKEKKKKTYPNASGTAFNTYKKKMGRQNESLRDFRENEKRAREKHGHPSVFIPLSQVTW